MKHESCLQTGEKNKGAAGIDGMEYCRSAFSFESKWTATQREYKKSVIQTNASKESGNPKKADGSNENPGIPTVTDRMVQQAMHWY